MPVRTNRSNRYSGSPSLRQNRKRAEFSLPVLGLILMGMVILWISVAAYIFLGMEASSEQTNNSNNTASGFSGSQLRISGSRSRAVVAVEDPEQQLLSVPLRTTWPGGRNNNDDTAAAIVTCQAMTDVRGNLGPASVLLQNGTDWIRDRWQAASDLHGTNIRGRHWVQLDWSTSNKGNRQQIPQQVVICQVLLDWEAAFANDYELQIQPHREEGDTEWTTILASPNDNVIHVQQWGQSPGVKTKTPLHILHTIPLLNDCSRNHATSSFRVHILKSATGWGVSLWQVQVYGYYVV